MHQLLISSLARLAIQPRNLLPTGVKITSNKNHKAPSVPRVSVLNQKLTRCGLEPSLLSNQSFAILTLAKGGFFLLTFVSVRTDFHNSFEYLLNYLIDFINIPYYPVSCSPRRVLLTRPSRKILSSARQPRLTLVQSTLVDKLRVLPCFGRNFPL